MPSTSEVGHAKNVANLQDLTSFITGYGAVYNPAKTALKLATLNTLYTTANTKLADVINKNTPYNNALNDRILAFSTLESLATRVVGALEATDAVPDKIKDAKGVLRKLRGQRATTAVLTPVDPETPAPISISSSQQSYDQKIQQFTTLISILQSEPTYTPNETDLKIPALNTFLANLVTKNNAVATAYTAVSNARIARDKTLYTPDTGLVDIALDVKKYIKSVFGASSPEFAQVKGLVFKKVTK